MDKQEKIDAEKTDIKDDAEKAEKVSKEEDKDYSKDTDDREKTIKDDAEKSERLNDDEKKDYEAIKKDYSDTDKRYVSRDEYSSLVKRMDELENKYKPSHDVNDDYKIDINTQGEVK